MRRMTSAGSAGLLAAALGATLFAQTDLETPEAHRSAATIAGADVILSNHTNYDGSKVTLPAVQARQPGRPHPYVAGRQEVLNYVLVASECTRAAYAEYLATP